MRHHLALGALILLALLGAAAPAQAGVHTWTGAAGDQLWSNAANWSGGVPTSGESGGTKVVFGASKTSVMDIDGLTVDAIEFQGSGSTINGTPSKPLSIRGTVLPDSVLSTSSGNSLGATLTLNLVGASKVLVRAQVAEFRIKGPITGSAPLAFTVNSGGPGTTLEGSSTFTGPVTVERGVLTLDNTDIDAAITGSSLQIGTATGNAASVKLAQATEIADTTKVTVKSDGTLDLQGAIEKIGDLTLEAGLVTNLPTATPSLTVGGRLTMEGGTIAAGGRWR